MTNYEYHLEQYKNMGQKHLCPECGNRTFVYYVDTDGKPLSETVGRCDREDKCGYHYTPKQFFADNPDKKREPQPVRRFTAGTRKIEPLPSYVPFDLIERSKSAASTLMQYLKGKLGADAVAKAIDEYYVGSTRAGETIFPQIDQHGNCRTGQVIVYNHDGHRAKGHTGWLHTRLLNMGMVQSFNLKQCLFGEHLLSKYPDKPVCLVEAPKTAVVASIRYPQYVWLATNGKANLSVNQIDKFKVLRGRTVIVWPDAGCYADWKAKAEEIGKLVGCIMKITDIIEKNATPKELERGVDLADVLLGETSFALTDAERTLRRMTERNPSLQLLIDKFKLQLVG